MKKIQSWLGAFIIALLNYLRSFCIWLLRAFAKLPWGSKLIKQAFKLWQNLKKNLKFLQKKTQIKQRRILKFLWRYKAFRLIYKFYRNKLRVYTQKTNSFLRTSPRVRRSAQIGLIVWVVIYFSLIHWFAEPSRLANRYQVGKETTQNYTNELTQLNTAVISNNKTSIPEHIDTFLSATENMSFEQPQLLFVKLGLRDHPDVDIEIELLSNNDFSSVQSDTAQFLSDYQAIEQQSSNLRDIEVEKLNLQNASALSQTLSATANSLQQKQLKSTDIKQQVEKILRAAAAESEQVLTTKDEARWKIRMLELQQELKTTLANQFSNFYITQLQKLSEYTSDFERVEFLLKQQAN